MKDNINKKTNMIAKNTLLLYLKQFISLAIGLFSVRIVLNSLGTIDYGIYNVVAGIVIFFSFIQNSLSSATQRFLNYELGKKDNNQARSVFSNSLLLFMLICIIVVILSETVGLWFVVYKLNIPQIRISSALICYQFSILSTIFSILRIPYNSSILCSEKMHIIAIIGLIETFLKFILVISLKFIIWDKLIYYSFILFLVNVIIFIITKYYCWNSIEFAKYSHFRDKGLFIKIIKFSSWSLLGGAGNIIRTQGATMLINIFFGVAVNTALAIANQVNSSIWSFVVNFQVAFKPQIVKSYVSNDKKYFNSLIFFTSKISFFLLLIIFIPFYLNIDFVLIKWLTIIPEYVKSFILIVLINSFVNTLYGPFWMAAQAKGNIERYQLFVLFINILNLPISYIFLKLGYGPIFVLLTRLFLNLIGFFWRVFYMKKNFDFSIQTFLKDVIFRCLIVCTLSLLFSFLVSFMFNGIYYFFISCISSVLLNLIFIYRIGFTSLERIMIRDICKRMIFSKSKAL